MWAREDVPEPEVVLYDQDAERHECNVGGLSSR
jgi:hypothetical protein